MSVYMVFDRTTGEISCTVTSPESQLPPEGLLPGGESELIYIISESQPVSARGQSIASVLDAIPHEYLGEYLVGSETLELRPLRVFVPASGPIPVGIDLDPSRISADAVITAYNQDGESVVVTDGSLTLIDTGWYRLTIEQPFPYHSLESEISVHD